MVPTVGQLKDRIPAESTRTHTLFDRATAPNGAAYGNVARYGYASLSIICSTVNVVGYVCIIPTRIITSFIYIDFRDLTDQCYFDACRSLNSLHFAAGMTAFIFATFFNAKYSLKPFPVVHPTLTSITVEPLIMPEQPPTSPVAQPVVESPASSADNTPNELEKSWISVSPEEDPIVPQRPIADTLHTLKYTFKSYVSGHNHLSKEMKYRHVMSHFFNLVDTPTMIALSNQISRASNSDLKTKCLTLKATIRDPSPSEDIRDQYHHFVEALRDASKAALGAKDQNDPCVIWTYALAYERFAGLKLYGYCEELVELASKKFTQSLSLDNFWKELESRNEQIKKMPKDQGIPWMTLIAQNAHGFFNIDLDSLLRTNLPYIYGQISKGDHKITILRHGTPIAQSEPFGIAKRCIWGGEGNTIPETTPDYVAFIEAAKKRGENILHLILEDGDWRCVKDESARVQARLNLETRPNFFPIALRMDGEFFHPQKYVAREMKQFKTEFQEQLLGTIETTGFYISDRVKQAYPGEAFEEVLTQCMNDVETLYFNGQKRLETLGDFQAFILLTYVQMTQVFCEKLGISILEAHCKDDIDRGGAFKAVLVLDHLYRTNNLTPQFLEQLMVSIIVAPLIVKKQPILKDRGIFIEHVINVIKRAANPCPEAYAYAGNFNTLSEPYQGVTPLGGTCRSKTEYDDFLTNVRSKKIILKLDIQENIVQSCAQDYKLLDGSYDLSRIKTQVRREPIGLYMTCNGECLNPNRKEQESFFEGIPDSLHQQLIKQNIPSDNAWEILATFQQGLGEPLLQVLQPLFNNEKLQYRLSQDTETMKHDPNSGLFLMIEQGRASIQFKALFKVTDPNTSEVPIAQIQATITIADHRTGHATVEATVS